MSGRLRCTMKSIRALAIAFMVLVCAAPMARAQAKAAFDLPAQPLADSLRAVGSQTNINLLFDPPLVAGKQAPALKAEVTADEALTRLLVGTGIKHEFLNETTIVLAKADAVASKSSKGGASLSAASGEPGKDDPKEGKKSSSQDFRVAQVDQANARHSAVDKDKGEDSESKKKSSGLAEIVVTGSRIPTVAGQQTVPVQSYTREDIAVSGQSTLGEFFNTLPDVSNFSQSSYQLGYAGLQTVQLHGLPIGTTLTLLDGRRVETSSLGLFDLSNIPVSSVERIEVLPVGGSAIYGADALAGAVNIILRKEFNGFEVNATIDHAPDVNDPAVNLAWGKSWERGSVSVIASYEERGELRGVDREPTSFNHFPTSASASTVLALGSDSCDPGNVYSVDGSNLPGLSSSQAGIPAGVKGTPTLQQFVPTAGKLNVCSLGRYEDITPWSQRESALLTAHYDLFESAELFTEILFSHRNLRNQFGPQISATQSLLPANNPYNPFGQEVNVSFAYPGAGQQETQSAYLIRPVVGVRGSMFSDWNYEATIALSRDRLEEARLFTDPLSVANALASSDPATALNPFASGSPGSPQLLSSLTNPAVDTVASVYADQLVSVEAVFRGPIVRLPAGAVQAAIGADLDRETEETTSNASIVSSASDIVLHRTTYAPFAEVRIPLLASGEQSHATERLTLTLAGRYDHSDDFGGKTTGQAGLLWRAWDTVSFSGSFGQSYRAPRLNEIAGPQVSSFGQLGITDPFRGNELETYPLAILSGPNNSLKPETGRSLTFGLTYTSEAIQGFRASITWYDLKISNYIGIPNSQAIVDNPQLFPGAVVRAPATPQDQQQGFLGVISQFNELYYNFGDVRVQGVDAAVSYPIDTTLGQFTPSLTIANIYRWTSALTPNLPADDGLSLATFNGVGWAPRWKGTASVAWKRGLLSANVAGRFVGRYLDYQDFVPNSNEIASTWVFDVSARAEIGETFASTVPFAKNAYVSIAAVNLLNKIPQFSYNPAWYVFQESDIRGRYLRLSVGSRF